ncbi:MAG TPA: SpoIIE family protein phosphatase [Acidimicrobiales bacterium]|nr:SpoIIE family protein phosphatase [Acidimicrobiales bacterium]
MSSDDALDAFYGALLDDDPTALYEKAPCGYLSTLPDGTIVKANETFLTITGYDRRDLVGKRTFAELLTAGGRIYHETHYAPMLQMQGSARAIALDIVRSDGTRLPVLVNAVLERDAADNPVIVRAAIFDATDRREYERELVRAKERAEASDQRATALARTLQRTLIPPTAPSIPGLDVAAAYRPAGDGDEVGGDFYDVFQVADDDWVVVIGDVSGKGVEAAVVTALARHTIRAAAVNEQRPSQILSTLNTVLLRSDTDKFCTVALIRLRNRDGAWTVLASNAGHPAPVLIRSSGVASPVGTPGSLLGILTVPSLTDTHYELARGDKLILYTDGVTEARGPDGFFGEDGLLGALEAGPNTSSELASALLAEVLAFEAGRPRDDIAIVSVILPT